MNLPTYMTVTEASKVFRTSRKYILSLIASGKIEASNITKDKERSTARPTWRIETAELLRFFDERKTDKEKLKLIHSTK